MVMDVKETAGRLVVMIVQEVVLMLVQVVDKTVPETAGLVLVVVRSTAQTSVMKAAPILVKHIVKRRVTGHVKVDAELNVLVVVETVV